MDFIKELQEARLTRQGGSKFTYTDCTERLYLSVLVLELLRRYPNHQKNVREYADNTSRYRGYDRFRIGASDLHNFIYFVDGPEEAQDKLRDPDAAKEMATRITLPTSTLNGYLESLRHGKAPSNADEVVLKLENSLKISNTDYKAIRRAMTRYESLPARAKKQLVTRLLYAARAKLRSGDIIDDLEKLAAERDLETRGVVDTEPTVSVPDLTSGGRDLANYRFLVGSKNLALTKHLLDRAKNGQAVSGNMLEAYLPIMQMVDNIVKGGPSFIQQLKVLEKRAKNSRN